MAFNQRLAGRIEPADAGWRSATAADRRAFYERAGELAVAEKRAELARAIGSNGRRMRPRKHPRPDGAAGPVMTPHDEESRTSRLLASRAWDGGLTLYWHSGTSRGQRTSWGTILGYHAAGQVRGAPIRDVRLSTRGVNRVKSQMATWWAERARDRAAKAARNPPPAPTFAERAKGAARGLARAAGRALDRAKRLPGDLAVRRKQAEFLKKYPGYEGYFRDPRDGFR